MFFLKKIKKYLLEKKTFIYKVFRYSISGGIAAMVHAFLLGLFVECFAVLPEIATAIAFLIAFFVSYFLQSQWTFKTQGVSLKQMSKFALVAVLGLVINVGIMFIVTKILGFLYWFGFFVATGMAAFVTFVFNNYWTYKPVFLKK